MADLPSYPADPLDEKQMTQFVMLCLEERDQNYKKYSDKIGATCAEGSKTPLKVQKVVVDRIKEVIKAKPSKHSAKQKFFALKLLNKVVMKKNMELNNYVEGKIMSRLTILAEFNNNPEEKSAQLLLSRGKNIFGPDEKDHQNSANFLIILLDCIEKWALTFQFEEGEVDDVASSSTRSKASTGDKFYRCYTKLIDKGVKFPSTFQGKDRQVKKKAPAQADQDEGPPQSQTQSRLSHAPQQVPDDAQSQGTSIGISPEKKERIGALKKKMQKVKELSKQAKKFVDKNASRKAEDLVDVAEIIQQKTIFEENLKLGENAISELMSDDIQPHISNSDSLAEKLFGYQEQFQHALQAIEKQIEVQRKIEEDVMGANRGKGPDKQAKGRRNSFGSDENPNVDEEVGPGSENKVAVSATSMGGRISHNMGQQPLRQAMMTNASTASEIKFEFGGMPSGAGSAAQDFQSSNFGTNFSENPYDFENFQNKEVFATQIQQNQNFDGFNFDMPQPNAGAQEKRKAPPAANDFGFDFGAPDPGAKPIKSQMFKEKVPLPPEEEDAVIKPKAARATMKNPLPNEEKVHAAPRGADPVEPAPVDPQRPSALKRGAPEPDENYRTNEFDPADAGNFDERAQNEPDGRMSVNRSLKSKNSMNEYNQRSSQIQDIVKGPSEPKVNPQPPADGGFDFNFGGGEGPANSDQIPVDQNQDFNFQFGAQMPQQNKPAAAEGFVFGEEQAPAKPRQEAAFNEFNFGPGDPVSDPNPPANNVPANKDDFFSYTEPAASEAQGAPIQGNQGFNDFNFDDYNGNQQQPAQDMSNQQDKGDFFFNDPQVSNPVQQDNDNDDGQIVAKKDAYLNYEDDQQQIAPQRPSYADDYGQIDKAPDIEQAKILQNKEILDYAEEMALRKTYKNIKQTDGADEAESMGSMMSDDIPAKLKSQKDLDNEQEIIKLRKYIKDERINRWWHGQQGQGSNELKQQLQHNYGLHQKSLMNNISQQIEQVEQYKTQIYSFEQENRILKEKYQQMVTNQNEDARRVSELEFEVDSFNAQISMIRQQCEKELRNKDDEVQQMKRAVITMKDEVIAAQQRCEQINILEENHRAALSQKDDEIENIRRQLTEVQEDSRIKQQQIDNFDIDKLDYEKQIRNLQNQLAEEISRSETSQANDIALAQAKESMEQQFRERESEMKAKIANLEAQLSMAMQQDIQSRMQPQPEKSVEERAAPSFNFNMPMQAQEKPGVEQDLGIQRKQDSASSQGKQNLNQRLQVPPQPSNQSRNHLDFNMPVAASQSMVVQPDQKGNLAADRGFAENQMAIQKQDSSTSQSNMNRPSNASNMFSSSLQSATTGPGSASQVVQPNPAFSFDMSGGGAPPQDQRQNLQNTPPKNQGSQQVSPQQLINNGSPGQQQQQQQQQMGQRHGTQAFQTNPNQINQQVGRPGTSFGERRGTNPTNPNMVKPQLQTSMSQQTLPPLNQQMSQGFQTPQPNSMQGQFQQSFQQELLKQKLQSFHLNSLIQGDKCVIYEDVNVKIGLVRQYQAPQGPNGEIKCMFKVFFRNHNQQQIPMHGVHMQFQVSEHGPQQQLVRIHRSSRPLPIRVPNTQPLNHNETVELDCDISIRPMSDPNAVPFKTTSVQGIKQMKFASIVLNLQYELNNGKKSGLLPILMPINILNFLQPCKSLNKYEYQGIWNKVVTTSQNQRPPHTACMQSGFTLDKQKVANMQRLMQSMTHCFHHVLEVDPQPNQISFAAQLKDICLSDPNQDKTWVLIKMELTKDGVGCKLQCISVKDVMQVALPVFESVLALVSKQA